MCVCVDCVMECDVLLVLSGDVIVRGVVDGVGFGVNDEECVCDVMKVLMWMWMCVRIGGVVSVGVVMFVMMVVVVW